MPLPAQTNDVVCVVELYYSVLDVCYCVTHCYSTHVSLTGI